MQMDCPNREFRAEIVSCCATSPSAQHNGIARANRTWNVAWRSMKHQVVSRLSTFLKEHAAYSQEFFPTWRMWGASLRLAVADLEDVTDAASLPDLEDVA